MVTWTSRANDEIQNRHSWSFLRRIKAVQLTKSERVYTPSMLFMEPVKSLTNAYINGNKLIVVNYGDWLDNLALYSEEEPENTPRFITLNDEGNILFHPTPNGAINAEIVYQRQPVPLVNNEDVPALDARYHEAIVAKALMYYADYEEDSYRYQRASIEYEQYLTLMANDMLPSINMARGRIG